MSNRVESWGCGSTPPTDGERREAAAKLREMVEHGLHGYSVMSALEDVAGESRLSRVFTRLADLIEPSRYGFFEEGESVYDMNPVDGVFCPHCHESFRVEGIPTFEPGIVEIAGVVEECVPNYCPLCGEGLDLG